MSGTLKQAVLAGFRAQLAAGGVSITYSRDALSVSITAIPGRTIETVESDFGIVFDQQRLRDWLILASDLVLDGSAVVPTRNDTITDAGGKTYRVVSIPGEPEYRYSDPYEQVFRVHSIET